MRESIAESINLIGDFCGQRDIEDLSQEALQSKYGKKQADVMVLFGGSILCGGDVLAQAIRDKVANVYVIVGGEGHTTDALRKRMKEELPQLETDGQPEAVCFQRYIEEKYGVKADYLETKSTNCGNNITYLLELLQEQHIHCESIILCQDATMQRRMGAVLKKYVPDMQIIPYAAYRARVKQEDGKLHYIEEIPGMWDMKRYVSLLLGEIQRLTDDENGYGPKGADFIAHVDIPEGVQAAYRQLSGVYENLIRKADPQYASPRHQVLGNTFDK